MAQKGISFDSPFDFLYADREDEVAIFGEYYCRTDNSHPREWTLTARVEKDPADGDGQPVEIDDSRLPARFYRLRALASTNSVGDPKDAFTLTTGSGEDMARLMVTLAEAIARGMVGLSTDKE